jgi:uncharacterized membrane protein
MVHLYRGEMHRMVTWRTRLDTTSHWAILLTAGMTTFTLGSGDLPHYVLLLGLAINVIFMLMEARRFQHLHHSKWRIKMLEQNYFAGQLCPARGPADAEWRERLCADLESPRLSTGLFLAARQRLRRNYLMLIYFVTAVWLTKLFIHPHSPKSVSEIFGRLAMGDLFPSWFVAGTAATFIAGCTVLALMTPSEETLDQRTVEQKAGLASSVSHDPQQK